ncbi:hypothetical protein FED29_020655 [Aeromonas veronii]|nr:hypothetical protein [Aeromonas veronii]
MAQRRCSTIGISYLEPHDLISAILTYVLSKGQDYWALDANFDHEKIHKYDEARQRLEAKALQLGEEFAVSGHKLDELGPNLFSNGWMPNTYAFGRGLAKGGGMIYERAGSNLSSNSNLCPG